MVSFAINHCMWRETTLGEVAEIGTGKSPKPIQSSGRYQIWGANGMLGYKDDYLEDAGVIVTGRVGTLGNIFLSSDRFWPSDNTLLIKPNDDVDTIWLYYFLQTAHLERLNTGSTQPLVTQAHLGKLILNIPCPEEQCSIAAVLSSLDDKIELLRRQNETLEQIAQTIFNEWFVKPSNARAPLRELVEFNPITPLKKDIVAPYFDMGVLPTVGSWPGEPVQRPFTSGAKFRNGDTLLARITPCLENGKTAFVQRLSDGEVAWGSTEFIVVRPKSPLPPAFGYLLVRSAAFRDFAIRVMSGTSGRQRVQVDMLPEYEVSMPSDDTVSEFSRLVEVIFAKIKNNAEQIDTLAATRDALLPRLMSGEIRL